MRGLRRNHRTQATPERGGGPPAHDPARAVVAALVFAPMAYMLWPQGAAIAPDAPSMPVTVGGTVFNIPPAAVRFKVQRRPGAQARVDLGFVWPSLEPPDDRIKPPTNVPPTSPTGCLRPSRATDSTLPPMERLKVIYPRYLDAAPSSGPMGSASSASATARPTRART